MWVQLRSVGSARGHQGELCLFLRVTGTNHSSSFSPAVRKVITNYCTRVYWLCCHKGTVKEPFFLTIILSEFEISFFFPSQRGSTYPCTFVPHLSQGEDKDSGPYLFFFLQWWLLTCFTNWDFLTWQRNYVHETSAGCEVVGVCCFYWPLTRD